MNPELTTLDLLRHGKCEGGEIYRGHTDVSLTAEGLAQMQQATAKLLPEWHTIIASPLKRCAVFAQQLAETHNIPVVIESGLREISFGQWEGRSRSEIWQNNRSAVEAWLNNPEQHSPPGGELTGDFYSRVCEAYQHILQEYSGQHILLVIHGGVIRVLLSYLLMMPMVAMHRLNVPYACVSRLQISHDKYGEIPYLLTHNGWQV